MPKKCFKKKWPKQADAGQTGYHKVCKNRSRRADALWHFYDHKGELFDTVHFPPTLKQYPFQGAGMYLLLGKIVQEFGYPMLEVQKMARMPVKKDPREG